MTAAPGTLPPSRAYASVAVGDVLPELSVPVTRTLIVATALASRDYQDVHHDPERARERGSKDIFMNILTSNGLVDRYVTGWAAPPRSSRPSGSGSAPPTTPATRWCSPEP